MDALLIRVFRKLSPQDRRSVADLAQCPYFNRRAEVVRLSDFLMEHIGKTSRKALQPERLFAAACPGEPYDNRRLRYIQSYLLDLIRQYLVLQEGGADPTAQTPLLLRALRRRGIDDLFEKTITTQLTQTKRQAHRDAQYHFQQYQLHQENLERATRHQRSARVNLQPLPDELTVFYVSEMLRHACLTQTHEAVSGQSYRLGLLEAILEAVERDAMLRIPAISVYYHAYRTLQNPEAPEPLKRLKADLETHSQCFPLEEQSGLFLLAINGCIRRMNAGQLEYVQEALELYRRALERNLLLENGLMSGFNYKNIIRLAVARDEHAWAEQFLENYRPSLHPRERDNLYRYNRAYLYFQQQDYARAMPLLQQVEFEDPLNNLDARRMLLRSYYELGEWQALDALLHSFAAYLRRQKNLGYHRQTNEKLLYFTRRLLDLDKADSKAVAALRAELEATPEVAERGWLLAVVR